MSTGYQDPSSDANLNAFRLEFTVSELIADPFNCFLKQTFLIYDPSEDFDLFGQFINLPPELRNMYERMAEMLRHLGQNTHLLTVKYSDIAENTASTFNICTNEQPTTSDVHFASTGLDCTRSCPPANNLLFVETLTPENFQGGATMVDKRAERAESPTPRKEFGQAVQEFAQNGPEYGVRHENCSSNESFNTFSSSESPQSVMNGGNSEGTFQESTSSSIDEEAEINSYASENEATTYKSNDSCDGDTSCGSDSGDECASDATMSIDDDECSLLSTEDEESRLHNQLLIQGHWYRLHSL